MIKLQSLTVDGFKNLKIDNLEFPPQGSILVIGRNESGKSTLFEAIFYALTNNFLVLEKQNVKKAAIAYNKNLATVELCFEKEGISGKIKRQMSRTRTGVSEVVDFWSHYGTPEEEHYSGKGKDQVKKVNDEIFLFLGFDKEVLLNSCFVEQKKIDEFLVKTKKDRKLIIDKLLNLEKLNYLKDD